MIWNLQSYPTIVFETKECDILFRGSKHTLTLLIVSAAGSRTATPQALRPCKGNQFSAAVQLYRVLSVDYTRCKRNRLRANSGSSTSRRRSARSRATRVVRTTTRPTTSTRDRYSCATSSPGASSTAGWRWPSRPSRAWASSSSSASSTATSDVVWDRRSEDKTGLRPKQIGLGLGLSLAGLLLCCETRSYHARRHNDLEGHINFSSTVYSFSILVLERHYCGNQQWRSRKSVKSAKCLVYFRWSWSWS